jgi:DNA modification methylase
LQAKRRFVGYEISEEYAALAERRIGESDATR